MSIRIRKVKDVIVALCAVETNAEAGDLYLDDAMHEALAVKFANDAADGPWYKSEPWTSLMESQRLRNAEDTF